MARLVKAIESTITRETSIHYRQLPLCVEVTAHAAIVRQKGQRDRVIVPWDAIFELGLKLRARLERAERENRRKG
jgi:hypothetical protein